jgi:hypothetical protein
MIRTNHLKIGASLALTGVLAAAGCGRTTLGPQAVAPEPQPSCAMTANVDRDLVAPVLDGTAVEHVKPLFGYMPTRESTTQMRPLEGASITVRPPPGVTPELLSRALTCRSAQLANDSFASTRTDTDPFWLPGKLVRIRVDSNPNQERFVIQVAGYDHEDARDILARAGAMEHR